MKKRVISRYEHSVLHCPRDITPKEFSSLARYHDAVSSDFFSLGYNSVRFNRYVGVIQVGDTVIEVLPKADENTAMEGYRRWRTTLLEMLEICRKICPRSPGSASQSTRYHSLLDIILSRYLGLVQSLIQQGLIRQYIDNQGHVSALKGRILFSHHLTKNLIRPDRWFTHHTIYDRNHVFHGMLRAAIEIAQTAGTHHTRRTAFQLAETFADFPSYLPTESFMARLEFNRKTERYRHAVEMAWLIIRSYCPDLGVGCDPVIALMFDMNRLYEETVYRLLDQHCRRRSDGVRVLPQSSTGFWESMTLKPDIIAKRGDSAIVIDTKWKHLSNALPSPDDLRQVFAYNLYFAADKAVLLYPGTDDVVGRSGMFKPLTGSAHHDHSCEVRYAALTNSDGRLSAEFAPRLIDDLFGPEA